MIIMIQNGDKIINMPKNEQWQVWIEHNKNKNTYEIFLTIGKTGVQQKVAEYKEEIDAKKILGNFYDIASKDL